MWLKTSIKDQVSSIIKDIELLAESNPNTISELNFEQHFQQIEQIFDLVMKNESILRKYKTLRDAILALFKDEFYDYWELKIGNDEMANMSPGKANLAILKLLIELSESNCPILIDQPEDNLDNRSIYSDLVQFIRTRKEHRQLIIVTHNPNIVVGADSENIIIANQDGQDSCRDNDQYRFEYVNGALEHIYPFDPVKNGILYKSGTRGHITEILEGGKEAF